MQRLRKLRTPIGKGGSPLTKPNAVSFLSVGFVCLLTSGILYCCRSAKRDFDEAMSCSTDAADSTTKSEDHPDDDDSDEQGFESGWSMRAWAEMKQEAVPLDAKLKATLGDFDYSGATGIQGGLSKGGDDEDDGPKRRKKKPGKYKFSPNGSWSAGCKQGRKTRRKKCQSAE